MDREVIYDRNVTGSYMKISAQSQNGCDEKILLKGKMKGLLAIELCYYNGQPWYWYNISGKQSLDVVCRVQQVGIDLIRQIILSICDEIEIMEWNLLDSACLVLDPEYIFFHNLSHEIIFTAYPGYGRELSKQIQELIEFLLTKMNHSDSIGVQTAYALYEKTLAPSYSLLDLRDFLLAKKKKSGTVEGANPEFKQEAIVENKKTEQKPYDKSRFNNNITEQKISERNKYAIWQAALGKLGKLFRLYTEKMIKTKNDIVRKSKEGTGNREITEQKKEMGVVYPDDPIPTVQHEIHPTVCLSTYHHQPKGVLLYEGAEEIPNITLKKEEIRVGQGQDADVQIHRETISQIHASIGYQDEEYYVEDLNSTNGTFVNEESISFKEKRKLETDDIVRFADVRFRFL